MFSWRQDPDVVTHADAGRLIGEPGMTTNTSLGEDFVEQHRIHTSDRQVGIRMHIVLVRNDDHAVVLFSSGEQIERQRCRERRDTTAAQIGERSITRRHRRHAR